MKSFFEEFKKFAVKGNVVDLAVAVVIGAAFGKIVSSLVDTIIMPLVGLIVGGVNFSDLSYTIGEAVIGYGAFIQAVIDFVIIALVIFIVVHKIAKGKEKEDKVNAEGREGALGQEKKEEEPPKPSEEVLLLREIRDNLKRS